MRVVNKMVTSAGKMKILWERRYVCVCVGGGGGGGGCRSEHVDEHVVECGGTSLYVYMNLMYQSGQRIKQRPL